MATSAYNRVVLQPGWVLRFTETTESDIDGVPPGLKHSIGLGGYECMLRDACKCLRSELPDKSELSHILFENAIGANSFRNDEPKALELVEKKYL